MLNLSDADLARLRLECLEHVVKHVSGPREFWKLADELVAWCLRDREVEE